MKVHFGFPIRCVLRKMVHFEQTLANIRTFFQNYQYDYFHASNWPLSCNSGNWIVPSRWANLFGLRGKRTWEGVPESLRD